MNHQRQTKLLLRLKIRKYNYKIMVTDAFWERPNPDDYSVGYPIISFIDRTHNDPYMPGPLLSKTFNKIIQLGRYEASEELEETVVLIAMAQKAAAALESARLPYDLPYNPKRTVFKVSCLDQSFVST